VKSFKEQNFEKTFTTIQDELTGRAANQKKLDIPAAKSLWPQNKNIQKQTIHRKTTFLNMLRGKLLFLQ